MLDAGYWMLVEDPDFGGDARYVPCALSLAPYAFNTG